MKTTTNTNNIEYVITVTNEANEQQVENLVSRAVIAYANLINAENSGEEQFKYQTKEVVVQKYYTQYATIAQCIAVFVDQPTSIVKDYIIARCHEEFGI